jgi:uncharacterized DUF497 family protein
MSSFFDWDDANIGHIALHGVLPEEFEEAIANRPIDLGYETRNGAKRFRQLGMTHTGRILVLVTEPQENRIRPVTAHDANRRLRAYYVSIRR